MLNHGTEHSARNFAFRCVRFTELEAHVLQLRDTEEGVPLSAASGPGPLRGVGQGRSQNVPQADHVLHALSELDCQDFACRSRAGSV